MDGGPRDTPGRVILSLTLGFDRKAWGEHGLNHKLGHAVGPQRVVLAQEKSDSHGS